MFLFLSTRVAAWNVKSLLACYSTERVWLRDLPFPRTFQVRISLRKHFLMSALPLWAVLPPVLRSIGKQVFNPIIMFQLELFPEAGRSMASAHIELKRTIRAISFPLQQR